jgi:hypothetical protein
MKPCTPALAICALLIAAGCGSSSSSSPAAATTASTTPAFPNIAGDWSGTQSVAATSSRTTDFAVTCNQTMTLKQSGGTFSGTFSASGAAPECVYGGTIDEGTVNQSGATTAKLTVTSNGQADCRRVQGDGVYRGTLSGTKLTLTMTESLDCTGPAETVNRNWTITTSKK